MSKQTLLIFLSLAIIIVGAISYDSVNASKEKATQSQQNLTSEYLPPTVPQTTLWLEPNPVNVDKDGNVNLNAYINTQENKVTAVQLEIAYDPSVLKFVSIKGTDLLEGRHELTKRIDEVNGRITFAAGISPSDENFSIQGADEIGKLVFMKLKADTAPTEVKLLPSSLVTARGVSKSVVIALKGTTVNLSE